MIAQTLVTAPNGQFTGLTDAWATFDDSNVYVSADGTQNLIKGDYVVGGSTDSANSQ